MPETKGFWDKLEIIGSVLTPLLVLIFGYLLVDSVNTALKREELQITGATEMRDLLKTFARQNVPREEAEAAALALAAFRGHAVAPLITILQTGGEVRAVAAENGLRALALTEPEEVCRQLTVVIENRTRLFSWMTHGAAIRLLGEMNCQEALPALRRYADLLAKTDTPEGLEQFRLRVQPDPGLNPEKIGQLENDLSAALRALERAGTPR